MTQFPRTGLNEIRQKSNRADYDRNTIYPIVDEALYCHVGFEQEGQPFVIPTLHARDGDYLYLHGSRGSRLLAHIKAAKPVCVTATILDGIVFARSAFHHSLNYRSAVLFGNGVNVESDEEKLRSMELLTEHVARGRWADARWPTRKELDATSIVRIHIDSASAKVRSGPPIDDEVDLELPIWAGVLPLVQQPVTPEVDALLRDGIPVPRYVTAYSRK